MKRLLRLFCLLVVSVVLASSAYAQDDGVLGKWKTIDDETGKAKSIVDVYVEDGKVYGKIIELFRAEGEDPDPVCDKCKGDYKDKKVLGMVIIDGLTEKDGTWTNGKILDPKKGKWYKTKVWVEDGKLQVKGYIAFLSRTQVWVRSETPETPETPE